MLASHEQISEVPGIKRGANFSLWAHGQMVAIGSRQPSGGVKGDCLREYSFMRGSTKEEIDQLFQYAAVSILYQKLLLITQRFLDLRLH